MAKRERQKKPRIRLLFVHDELGEHIGSYVPKTRQDERRFRERTPGADRKSMKIRYANPYKGT